MGYVVQNGSPRNRAPTSCVLPERVGGGVGIRELKFSCPGSQALGSKHV